MKRIKTKEIKKIYNLNLLALTLALALITIICVYCGGWFYIGCQQRELRTMTFAATGIVLALNFIEPCYKIGLNCDRLSYLISRN